MRTAVNQRENPVPVRIGIIGSGYGSAELMGILARHSNAEVRAVVSRSQKGAKIDDLYPSLTEIVDRSFESLKPPEIARRCDVVFCCTKPEESIQWVRQLMRLKVKCIDLSGAYRLKDPKAYKQWYGERQTDRANLSKAVYGLPELKGRFGFKQRDLIRCADLIANPGCFATSVILALAPLERAQLLSREVPVNIFGASGISGAGRQPRQDLHFPEINESMWAYRIGNHQHVPEIEQACGSIANGDVTVNFVPHVIPATRGIYTTILAKVSRETDEGTIRDAFRAYYKREPFIRLRFDTDVSNLVPQLKDIAHTNFCDIGVWYDPGKRTVIVISTIDNLIKGAAGQAVQNMNIVFGREEMEGLLPTKKF